MKIAFFGLAGAFDFQRIGGVDSLARRLALRLVEAGEEVDFVHYGAAENRSRWVHERLRVRKCVTFAEALEALVGRYDHVVAVYLRPRERIRFARFRRAHSAQTSFHRMYLVWPESGLKRQLLAAEARLWPYNGCLFCVSPRILRQVARWAPRAALLLPPVPDSYFVDVPGKPSNGTLRVTYAGRLDSRKGTPEALAVLRELARRPGVEARVHGFAWAHRPETVQWHEKLLRQSNVRYEPARYEEWTPDAEEKLRQALRDTDVLLLPYRKLSSTVDTPLLLLEGMAGLCAVAVPPLGDLQQIYGPSDFHLRHGMNPHEIADLIARGAPRLAEERQRVQRQARALRFDSDSVARRFRDALAG